MKISSNPTRPWCLRRSCTKLSWQYVATETGKPRKSQNSSKIMKFHQIGAGLPRKPADRICQKNWRGSQNSPSRQLKIVVAPSSDGVERKTGYVGLRTRWVRSRELVFKKNWEVKKCVFPSCQKKIQFPDYKVTTFLDGLLIYSIYDIRTHTDEFGNAKYCAKSLLL